MSFSSSILWVLNDLIMEPRIKQWGLEQWLPLERPKFKLGLYSPGLMLLLPIKNDLTTMPKLHN